MNASPEHSSEEAITRLGGPSALEAIVADFVDRVRSDMMIGFFFRKVDLERLKRLEYEFASSHLGGSVPYTGRPLEKAHGPHRIMGGQFNRRLKILEKTLVDHGVPADIRSAWLAHNESLRAQITSDASNECRAADVPQRLVGTPAGEKP